MNAPLRTYRPPAADTQNHRCSATTRVAPFAHLHISSFANSTYNSSPITHNSLHSFSAKERDAETGLSYFGSRYYSADLSIWLSVDPMSGKYPSLSPYVYCANNPVKCVDPNGATVVIPNESDQKFIDNLTNPKSKDYSKEFCEVFNQLKNSDHTYTFISREYNQHSNEDGLFENIDKKNSNIYFTKDDNPQCTNPLIGASKYRVLFEEVSHAVEYDNERVVNKTCISEAIAWKFSTKAPGTKLTYYDSRSNTFCDSFMGVLSKESISSIAVGFKFGIFPTENSSGHPALYPDIPLGNKQQMLLYFPFLNNFPW